MHDPHAINSLKNGAGITVVLLLVLSAAVLVIDQVAEYEYEYDEEKISRVIPILRVER